MSNNLIYLHNVETDEIRIEEMTEEQQASRDAQVIINNAEKKSRQDVVEAAWKIKIQAYEKLGLTSEEIEAIAPKPEWLKDLKALGLG